MTTLYTVNLVRNTVVDAFSIIPAGSAGYIQNISNREVCLSDTATFENELVLGGKIDQPEISTLTFEAGDGVFLKTLERNATVTIAVGSA